MSWSLPQALYLILPLCLGWFGLSLFSRGRRIRAALAFVAPQMQGRILPGESAGRFWGKLFLRQFALVAGLVALAGPQYGQQEELVLPRGSDLYVLIDVSRSMLATDVPPSRLSRAKADVAALVNRLEGERIGLIAFAGQAVVKCPLTVDYDSFRRALAELDPNSAPRGGTAIGDAIRKALEVFDPLAGRDQAILLITDGDDQKSYPLDAAAVAAERKVAIFAVGLGDSEAGARIPTSADATVFVEHQGQQVWSKLDGGLLEQIALKTQGVYVPAGTRSYDLAELYAAHLRGRRGDGDDSRVRVRRAEQFQVPLALALLALVGDVFLGRHRPPQGTGTAGADTRRQSAGTRQSGAVAAVVLLGTILLAPGTAAAEEATTSFRAGLRHYEAGEYDQAHQKFSAARQELDSRDARLSAVAAFDEACAAHRKGDLAAAREAYLKAGLAHDRKLAAAAHFNLGTLTAEEARGLAGEQPVAVPVEKRQEILDKLKSAVASFRHTLELDPGNTRARRDIELVRLWIKYHTDRWHEADRERRRRETNLLQFLEFLIETQRALRGSVRALQPKGTGDAFAELRRLQLELREEVDPLKEKIDSELRPSTTQAPAPTDPPADSAELEQALAQLKQWADRAGSKMESAAGRLGAREGAGATEEQQAALENLEQIWEGIVPFQPLLARALADQTRLARDLNPTDRAADPGQDGTGQPETTAGTDGVDVPNPGRPQSGTPKIGTPGASPPAAVATSEIADVSEWIELQEQTRRRTQLLQFKAGAELQRLEQPAEGGGPPDGPPLSEPEQTEEPAPDSEPSAGASGGVDPEAAREGFRKALELAPQALEQMDQALTELRRQRPATAHPPAEEARRILREIQLAQPKPPPQKPPPQEQKQDQEQQQQQNQSPQDQSGDSEPEKDNQAGEKPEDDPEGSKQEESKPDPARAENQPSADEQQAGEKKPKEPRPGDPRGVDDRLEEALRKVRERQEAKRDRDRRLKARLLGRPSVEKDW